MPTLAPLESTRFCILLALSRRATHGYAIQEQIDRDSGNLVHIDYSTIYKALRRLEQDSLIKREAAKPTDAQRIRYRLTPAGKRALKIESDRLEQAVGLVKNRI